jgi:isopenicillin N synthase-like dioxygenase
MDHGLSGEVIQEAFSMIKRLFDLSMNEKMKVPHPKAPTPHRGYTPPGGESASGVAVMEASDGTEKESLNRIADYKVLYLPDVLLIFEHKC